jgi:hypothetical protein
MSVTFSDHQAVVSIVGELDLVDRDVFTSLMEQVRARHPQRIVMDLANLEFLRCRCCMNSNATAPARSWSSSTPTASSNA